MKVQNLYLETGERKQSALLHVPDNASGAGVLFLHGYQSSKNGSAEYAEALAQRMGTTSMVIDLPGHGESEGDFNTLTPRDYLNDAVEAYSFLGNEKNVDLGRIGVVGASYGGYLAALLAAEKNPKRLLLRAPAIYPDTAIDEPRESVDKEALTEFRRSLAFGVPFNAALDSIRNFDGRVVVVESENDESIQPSVIDAYMRASQNGLLRVIPGARHSLVGPEREMFKDVVIDWATNL